MAKGSRKNVEAEDLCQACLTGARRLLALSYQSLTACQWVLNANRQELARVIFGVTVVNEAPTLDRFPPTGFNVLVVFRARAGDRGCDIWNICHFFGTDGPFRIDNAFFNSNSH